MRPAKIADIPRIHNITLEAFKQYADSIHLDKVDALEETFADIEQDIAEKTVLVAETSGTNPDIVGSLRLQFLPDGTVYLTRFGVCKNQQNNGIGKALMDAVDNLMHEKGIHELHLHTATRSKQNVVFYYRVGFYIDSITHDRGYSRGLFIKTYE